MKIEIPFNDHFRKRKMALVHIQLRQATSSIFQTLQEENKDSFAYYYRFPQIEQLRDTLFWKLVTYDEIIGKNMIQIYEDRHRFELENLRRLNYFTMLTLDELDKFQVTQSSWLSWFSK